MAFWFIASLASCSASSWSLSVYRLVGLLFFVSSWLLSGLSPRRPLGSHCLVYRLVGLMFALVLFACWFIALSASCFTSSWLPSRLSPCWPRVLFSHLVVIFLVYRLLGLVFCTFLVASCFIALSALLFACSGLPFCLSPRRPCLQFSFVCFSGLSPRRPCLHSLVIYLIHIIACHHLFRLKGRFLSSPRSGIAITICLVSCCFFTRSLAIVFSPHHHFWDGLFIFFFSSLTLFIHSVNTDSFLVASTASISRPHTTCTISDLVQRQPLTTLCSRRCLFFFRFASLCFSALCSAPPHLRQWYSPHQPLASVVFPLTCSHVQLLLCLFVHHQSLAIFSFHRDTNHSCRFVHVGPFTTYCDLHHNNT